jgi:hypothetical protein
VTDTLTLRGPTSSTNIDTANTTITLKGGPDEDDEKYLFATILDNCDDSSVDTNIWTVATGDSDSVTENNNYMIFEIDASGSDEATATADQANAVDYKALSGDSQIYLKASIPNQPLGDNARITIQLTDGGSSVNLYQVQDDESTSYFVKIVIDKSAETADVYVNGSSTSTNVDLSSLSNYYLKIGSTNFNDDGDFYLHYVTHVTTTSDAQQLQSSAITATHTITSAFLYVEGEEANNGTFTYSLSADGGSHWETATANKVHKFTNTGTSLKVRVVFSQTSIDAADEDNAGYIKGLAVLV